MNKNHPRIRMQPPLKSKTENILDAVQLPDFGKIATGAFWVAVVSITLVTAIESLLSAIAVDSMDVEHRKTNLNNDLKALGFGASVSGFIGGLYGANAAQQNGRI